MNRNIQQKLATLAIAGEELTNGSGSRSYRDHFENNQLPMVWADQDGTVINCNVAMASLLGKTKDEIVGHSVSSYAHPAKKVVQALSEGDGCRDFSVEITTADGPMSCRLYSNVHRDRDGNWINSRCVLVPGGPT